jgi:hypothetical protein
VDGEDGSDVGHDIGFVVRWQNFRSFQDTGWVRLAPLTLLLGPNSAGKSSFIAPLLLLKQSLYSRTGTNALLTRGEFVDAGVFPDFIHNHDVEAKMLFGVRWHSHPASKATSSVGRYPPGGLRIEFASGADPQTVSLSSYRVEDTYRRTMLSRVRRDDGRYALRMVSPEKTPSGARRASKGDAKTTQAMRAAIAEAQPTDFLFRSREIREAGLAARRSGDRPSFKTTIDDDRSRVYCSIADHTEWGIRSILENLHYIGPLRDEPKRVYELSGEMPDSVGTRGEFAPEILYRWRADRKRMREVNRWLRRFGFSEELAFSDVGTGGFSLVLVREGTAVASTFLDTGFGMSQVLPLIVQGLMSEPGDWVLIEQPEIHLNPKLQAALGDLLSNIVKRGVGLVIESHSEHLLLRLRHLMARRDLADDALGLYFVEQGDDRSTVRSVPVEASGFIAAKDWPHGFFEDSLRESMALAQAQLKERQRQSRAIQRANRQSNSGTDRVR